MSFRSFAFFVLCFVVVLYPASAQIDIAEYSSWEYEDIAAGHSIADTDTSISNNPIALLGLYLVDVYQDKISTQSVSRCPFYISCSNYLLQAIQQHGFLAGLLFFIDRNLYRENISSFYHYHLREDSNGVLKLDDNFYIYGAKK
jgi:putative component of membrane protein insertase Oxa1/YidC/SpoIIIJ protein YidD